MVLFFDVCEPSSPNYITMHGFLIFDILFHSGDMHNQSLKFSESTPNFGTCFKNYFLFQARGEAS